MTKSVLVCARITTPLLIEDNDTGKCAECGWRIQFRPHAPKVKKLCMKCASGLYLDDPNAKFVVTKRMVEDFIAWKRRREQ